MDITSRSFSEEDKEEKKNKGKKFAALWESPCSRK